MLTNASFSHQVSEDIEPADAADGSLLPTNERFMAAAVMSAMSGVNLNEEGGPFGASIVRDGVLICSAHNTFFSDCDPTCHAEMNAIRLAMRRLETHDLSDCVIYSSFEPCPMCWGAIVSSGMKQLYIGLDRFTAAKNGVDYLSFYDAILPHTKGSNFPPMTRVNPPSFYEDKRIISMLSSPDHCIIVNKDNDILANSDSPAIDDFTDPVDTSMVRTIRLACRSINSPYLHGCRIYTLVIQADVESHAACLWACAESLHYCTEASPGSK
ncbi:hypothetical protein FOZ61_010980 [Perkinsus olseni]|uniref:CMP/dCMP-type deaminase domain-containing protein n=1 Tax=Perkinsus olseni TaxID=32597 RepID=A0A7J6KW72_PEROL|nr:hypothetical protein FOZ61_010980 [Perkinsus olseni]KAF4657873.1 hypothetical protein FOL46_007250 [Perkinsus olseni]